MEQQLKGLTDQRQDQQTEMESKTTGNLIVLIQNPFHISIGPNYKQFLIGFSLLFSLVIIVAFIIQDKVQDGIMKIIGKMLGVTAVISYLFTTLNNPGVYDPIQNFQSKTRYCHKCMHFKPKDVIHCYKCDTCIQGYDHHCPWISKCVGKGNIIYFYTFMASLSLFSIYVWYIVYLILMVKTE